MLFTQDNKKPMTVKFPSFSGASEEDYSKFKEEILKAFVQNRIQKTDQLSKLRECLKNHAKILVPDSTDMIDVACSDRGMVG